MKGRLIKLANSNKIGVGEGIEPIFDLRFPALYQGHARPRAAPTQE